MSPIFVLMEVPGSLHFMNIFNVIEFMSGEGAYAAAHRSLGRNACAVDIKDGHYYDLSSPSGFAWAPDEPMLCFDASIAITLPHVMFL